ncbi:Ig-like domain-containing protein [Pantoea stewartii]|uniref:Ig-like domain-containing protein n=1 Tax=Pantoea stewartii TaxID=66269 RepID=UPI003367E449
MDQHFFRIPFASNGDKQPLPEDKTIDGYVSFTEGWGADYEKDLLADIHAKAVERTAMNAILNAITIAIRQYQSDAFPEWITPQNNGGTAYPYGLGVVVRHRTGDGPFISYVSLTESNTAEPGKDDSKWQAFIYRRATQQEADEGENENVIITPPTLQNCIKNAIGDVTTELAPFLLPVGVVVAWGGNVPPDGWLEANGQAFDPVLNPKLLAVYPSGHVPDLRGRFIRGWAHGSAEDPDSGRDILSYQSDSIPDHTHIAGTETMLWDNVPVSNTRNTPGGAQGRQYQNRTGQVNPEWGSFNISSESRPKNIAMMYIVKTDQADNIKPDPTPTNIIVSPSSLNIGVGETQKFTAQVLPADLAQDFPVTWLSTDTAVGTIDENGVFKSLSAGTTEIIASISSGLSVSVNVRVDVLLTSISLTAIPVQTVGDTYQLIVLKTPSNATESLTFDTSDGAVANVSADGQLFSAGEGSATISVTGNISAKKASRIVEVIAAEVESDYLAIKNYLSEIAEAGKAAQKESRNNLALGDLAVKDSLTATDVDAVPVATESLSAETNLNDLTEPGEYFQSISSYATPEKNYPVNVAGSVKVTRTGVEGNGIRQVYTPYNSGIELWRHASGSPLLYTVWADTRIATAHMQSPLTKERLMQVAETVIRPLERAVKLGVATEEEKTSLEKWEMYSVLLHRVDPDNPKWPQVPE